MTRISAPDAAWSRLLAAPLAALSLLPVAALIVLAWESPLEWDARNTRILLNTLVLTATTVAGALALGIPLAFATTCLKIPGSAFLLTACATPLAVPSYLGAFAYFAASGTGGEFEEITGVAMPAVRGLFGTALIMTLYTFPFVLLSVRASLRGLDVGMVEAARTLGLPPSGVFFRVILPRIQSGIATGALLVALYTLSDFSTPAILGFDTFTRAIFVEYHAFGLDRAAWLSLQLLLLVAIVLWLESSARTVRESSGRRLTWKPSRTAASACWLAASAVWLAAVGLPVSLFCIWLAREGTPPFDAAMAGYSILVGTLAASAAVVCALPLACAAGIDRLGRLMQRMTTFGFGIPGIVMGTALVYVSLRLPFLYQTTAMLVLGYVLRFLPLATGSLREGLERLDGYLVPASRTLGATPGEAFRRIVLPLMRPAVLSGAALVFLESLRELPLALLLRPTGRETLTTRLWEVYEAGHFGGAALPGLILIAASSLAMLLFTRSERLLGLAAEAES